jgi:hypothetical protein
MSSSAITCDEGFVYMSVQWARMVTEALGSDYGLIDDGRDGYDIIKDAARFPP